MPRRWWSLKLREGVEAVALKLMEDTGPLGSIIPYNISAKGLPFPRDPKLQRAPFWFSEV